MGGVLKDVGNSPNTVMGASDGSFVSQTIGFTRPSGAIGRGVYAVVYDECQDGKFDPNVDFALDPAFEVGQIPSDVPKLPSIANIKNEAGAQESDGKTSRPVMSLPYL